ncbi:MAG: transposase, partial [Actinomycetota bacterium]|nr:transposase [Actinomycetota bacterium]
MRVVRRANPCPRRITLQVSSNGCVGKVEIAADGDGLVSRSGTALLAELADRLGLTRALSDT